MLIKNGQKNSCFFYYFIKFCAFLTVSGMHARLEKKDGLLLVTDLDSTNGTFINEQRLKPGAVTPVPPGSYITFGISAITLISFFIAFCGFNLVPSILAAKKI
jgi:pSer/pThr/pTyr-binding forkhead associated (FHA) protein